MKFRPVAFAIFVALTLRALSGADQLTITVTHDLAIARPSETIVVPWSQVNAALPGALLQAHRRQRRRRPHPPLPSHQRRPAG